MDNHQKPKQSTLKLAEPTSQYSPVLNGRQNFGYYIHYNIRKEYYRIKFLICSLNGKATYV